MLTIYGEGRGFRVAWLLEEMGLPYRLRQVDLLQDVTQDTEFMAINPGGFIPALVDGDVVIVESIAIMDYLTGRYGPTPLAPDPQDPAFPLYRQYMLMGEAGLAGPANVVTATRMLAPASDQDNWTVGWARETFRTRLGLVSRQLARAPYMAGDVFTAADISVTYALELAKRTAGFVPGAAEAAYIARTTGREAYARAMDACPATKAWVASLNG